MPVLTLADLRTEARDTMLDTDSANYGVDPTTLDRFINKAYIAVKGLQDDRPQFIIANNSGAIYSAGDRQRTLILATIRRILNIYPTSSGSNPNPTGGALEHLDEWEIRLAQSEDSAQGTPVRWGAVRQGADNTAASQGFWTVMLHPLPDGAKNYVIEALVTPALLTGTTEAPDVDDITSYAIAWIAAAVGARTMGRSEEFIADIKARIPDQLQAAYGQMQRELVSARDVEKR